MAIFKCKMCGGTLDIEQNESVAICEYCGTKQTLPRFDDEKRVQLYDRANYFRRLNEYDKAMGIYEMILSEDKEDSEAYWSIVLCKYGIEYVEDPRSGKRIPTVNRAQYTSIFDDEDYLSALKYADELQKEVYQSEAKTIDIIQKGILDISSKEKPFDVFICYKETGADGERTSDSVYAQDIYNALVKEGYKVFFSRITLETKLGQQYEPYIFAALHSAKVMLVVGTRKDYFEAVWVKNEWSRYLALTKDDESKILIPCYKDISPYDMPEEFTYLQSQDIGKIGFMQDLLHGISKVVKKEPAAKKTVVVNNSGSASAAPLLKRAFMFLEDGDWQSADEYCEKVLDLDPENAEAYLGKLMAELQVHKEADLADREQPFDNNGNYQKAVRFADASLKNRIESYIKQITDRINAKETELNKTVDAVAKAVKEKAAGRNIVPLKEQLAKEKAKLAELQALAQSFDSILAEIEKGKSEVRNIELEINGLKTKRESLGLFAVKEKKQIDTEIEELDAKKLAAENALNSKTAKLLGFSTKQEVEAAAQQVSGRIPELEAQVQESANSGNIELTYAQAITLYYSDKNIRKRFNEKYSNLMKSFKIKFGSYYKSFGSGKEPIEWITLDTKGDKILLISKYALDCQKYNKTQEDVTWETCTLRKWLNGTFINAAFSEDEKKMIQSTKVTADKNPKFDTLPGNDTNDKVFLLSISEAEKYFASDAARRCIPTDYAVDRGAYIKSDNDSCCWWLRSPGDYPYSAAAVYYGGNIDTRGNIVFNVWSAVRPAMWVKF